MLPVVNAWTVLPVSQQNLLMSIDTRDGDRPVPDDITFKTKDGNNVYIDVNVMWRIDPLKAGFVVSHVGQSVEEVKERVVRPLSRSIVRDVFNEITSEEYYQVTVKNRVAAQAKEQLAAELARVGVVVDMLQLHQHRFDPEYQEAINAQKQAEADVQMLMERQKAVVVQKQTELEARRSQWNQKMEQARGEAGRVRNDADGYYQTQTNQAKAIVATAQAEADGVRKEAEALGKLGGDAYVKIQVSKRFAEKRIFLVPGSNVSTLDVNQHPRLPPPQRPAGGGAGPGVEAGAAAGAAVAEAEGAAGAAHGPGGRPAPAAAIQRPASLASARSRRAMGAKPEQRGAGRALRAAQAGGAIRPAAPVAQGRPAERRGRQRGGEQARRRRAGEPLRQEGAGRQPREEPGGELAPRAAGEGRRGGRAEARGDGERHGQHERQRRGRQPGPGGEREPEAQRPAGQEPCGGQGAAEAGPRPAPEGDDLGRVAAAERVVGPAVERVRAPGQPVDPAGQRGRDAAHGPGWARRMTAAVP